MEYDRQTTARQSQYGVDHATGTSESGRSFNSIYSIPHASQIHAFATTPCCSHLFTGGADGFVRRYALAQSLNPASSSSTSTSTATNLTMKQQPVATEGGAVTNRVPVLTGYWENEEPPTNELAASDPKWGTKTTATGPQSAVYSLAVHSQELWGLSGTSKGSINLFTIRHDQGQIRHVFRPDPSAQQSSWSSSSHEPPRGHSSSSPVSVLTLDRRGAESSFLSGGWDGRIFDWDLNTGDMKQAFLSHGPHRQISSISYRPTSSLLGAAAAAPASRASENRTNGGGGGDSNQRSMMTGTTKTTTTTSVEEDRDAEGEPDEEDVEMDADGEVDDTLASAENGHDGNGNDDDGGGAATKTKKKQDQDQQVKPDPAIDVPLVNVDRLGLGGEQAGGSEGDVFMSTSLDGLVLVWDKRIGSNEDERAQVYKLEDFGNELDRLGLGGCSGGGGGGREENDVVVTSSGVGNGTGGGGRKRSTRGRDKWSTAACWSPSGDQIYVARHSSVFSCYDLRQGGRGGTGTGAGAGAVPVSTYALPRTTGPITTINALANGGGDGGARQVVTGSWDCVRVWDLDKVKPFARGDKRQLSPSTSAAVGRDGGVRVVGGGHYGGTLSSLHVDPLEKWMFTTSGTRGWDGNSTENLVIHEIVKT